jgi:hypothetical protein
VLAHFGKAPHHALAEPGRFDVSPDNADRAELTPREYARRRGITTDAEAA